MINEPYGICSHVNRRGNEYEYDTRKKELLMIDSLHVDYIRTDFDWSVCLPDSNHSFSFVQHRNMMNDIDGRHQVLGILTPYKTYRTSIGLWNSYVDSTVGEFEKDVKYWEIINEADRVGKRIKDFSVADYAEMLKSAYKRVKLTNSEASVLYSGVPSIRGGFIEDSFKLDVSDYFDIMNIHWYSDKGIEPEDMIACLEHLEKIMTKYQCKKPVWLTETGCTTLNGWATEEVQAQRLPRIYIIALALGIDKVFWYKSRSSEISLTESENYYGLWHSDYAPKPAFRAYRYLIEICPNYSSRPVLEKHGDVYLASWSNTLKKKVFAIWSGTEERRVRININGAFDCFD